jgi:hypothetical protein
MTDRTSTRASIIATLTAVAAIVLGVVDSMQNRAHNRLSVAPFLVTDHAIQKKPGEWAYVVLMSNEGVGPAIIDSVTIIAPPSLGGATYGNGWNELVGLLSKRGIQVSTYWNFEGGEALGADRSRQVFRALVPTTALGDSLLRELQHLQVIVKYSSIYKQQFISRLMR